MMSNLMLLSYSMSFLGLFLGSVYGTVDALQRRRSTDFRTIGRIRQNRMALRNVPMRKFGNGYRSKMFRRRLMNEVNRINTKLRIRAPRERYQLYYDAEGNIRVRCKTMSPV